MKRTILCALAGWLALAPAAPAAADKLPAHTIKLEIPAQKADREGEPVRVALAVPVNYSYQEDATIRFVLNKKPQKALGQLTAPGLGSAEVKVKKGEARRDLHFILPKLKAGEPLELTVSLEARGPGLFVPVNRSLAGFGWTTEEHKWAELSFTTLVERKAARMKEVVRPVLRYMHLPLDENSDAARVNTFKVFHQVYTPDGKAFITKGPGGQFTHHRGLFYGFSKASYDKHTVDIWHCHSPKDKKRAKQEAHQAHQGFGEPEHGAVLGRHVCKIDWNGVGKKTFAKELREVTAYNVPGGTLIEFVSQLTPTGGEVTLDGDPQHAGFHFRASNEVAEKTKSQTIFIRPSGTGKPGTEVNWPKDKKHVNLPWLAMSFVVGGKRYTAAYLDHPNNPKEARFSERTYGRFGSYFVAKATKDKPLVVRYRVWLQDGQMTGEQVKAKATAFVTPVEVTVKKKS